MFTVRNIVNIYDEDEIRKILDPDTNSQQEASHITHRLDSRGPNQPILYNLYFQKNKSHWQEELYIPQKIKTKKILFSNTLLFSQRHFNSDQKLMVSLFQLFTFYFWPGEDQPLHQLRPLADTTEFWQNRSKCKGASRKQILEALANQSISPDEYLILDFETFEELRAREFGDVYHEHRLNADHFLNFSFDEYSKCVDVRKIHEVKLSDNNNNVDEILRLPNLKKLTITDSSYDWLINNLYKMSDYSLRRDRELSLELSEITIFSEETLFLPNSFKKMTISNGGELSKIEILKSTKDSQPFRLELSDCKELTTIELNGNENILIFSDGSFQLNDNNINSLILTSFKSFGRTKDGTFFLEENISIADAVIDDVTVVGIKASMAAHFNVEHFPNLDELQVTFEGVIGGSFKLPNMAVKNIRLLCEKYIEVNIENMIDVESLVIFGDPIPNGLEKLTNLRTLKFVSIDSKASLRLPPNIEHLMYEDSNINLITIDNLSACKQLTHLSLIRCKLDGNTIFQPIPQLKRLNLDHINSIISFPQLSDAYPNLETFSSIGMFISPFDLKYMPKLKHFYVNNCILSCVDSMHLASGYLETIEIQHSNFIVDSNETGLIYSQVVDLSDVPNLRVIKIDTPFIPPKDPKRVAIVTCGPDQFNLLTTFINLKCLTIRNKNSSECILPHINLSSYKKLEFLFLDRLLFDVLTLDNPNLMRLHFSSPMIAQKKKTQEIIGINNSLRLEVIELNNHDYLFRETLNLPTLKVFRSENSKPLNLTSYILPNLTTLQAPYANQVKINFSNHPHLKEYPHLDMMNIAEPVHLNEMVTQTSSSNYAVARFSLHDVYKSYKPSHLVAKDNLPRVATGNIKVGIISKTYIHQNNYIYGVLSDITYVNREINFATSYQFEEMLNAEIKSCSESKISELSSVVKKNEGFALSIMIITNFSSSDPLPIVADQPLDAYQEIWCTKPDNLVLCYDKKNKLFAVKLKPGITDESFTLLTIYKRDNTYTNSIEVIRNNPPLPLDKPLSQELVADMDAYLTQSQYNSFSYLHRKNHQVDSITKLILLAQHLSSFYEPEFNLDESLPSLDRLFNAMHFRVGACEQRAHIIFLFARYYNFTCNMPLAPWHIFGELTLSDHSRLSLNLGGGVINDVTNKDDKTLPIDPSVFKEAQIRERLNVVEQVDSNADYIRQIRDRIKAVSGVIETGEVSRLLGKGAFAPLVMLQGTQTVKQVASIICAYWIENFPEREYLYIHEVDDFDLYQSMPCIINGEPNTTPGPYHTILEQGGLLIVNWSNFSPSEIMSFKWLLENTPAHITLIGIADKKTYQGDAFNFRSQKVLLTPEFFTPEPSANQGTAQLETVTIDLDNDGNWTDKLLVSINDEQDDEVEVTMGSLVNAALNNKSVIINNPPQDKQLTNCLDRIEIEKRLIINGKKLPTSKEFRNTLQQHHSPVISLPNITIGNYDSTKLTGKNCIPIALYNLFECDKLLQVENGKLKRPAGYIHTYRANIDVFFLTQSIAKHHWIKLLKMIQLYPDTQFDFLLGPGVSIEGITEKTNAHIPKTENFTNPPSKIITSNDVDFAAGKLRTQLIDLGHEVIIVFAKPDDAFSDLFYDISTEKTPGTTRYVRHRQEHYVLKQLSLGKTVILVGDIAENFYQRIIPYMQSYRLYLIMPSSLTNNYPLVEYTDYPVDFSIYKQHIPLQDQSIAEMINTFYDYAYHLPHNGKTMPTEPFVSFARLKRMIENVKSVNLAHHALKEIFVYDYPKGSEEYAYINVLAKFLLQYNEYSHVRGEKLLQIVEQQGINIQQLDDIKCYLWRILNCFSGLTLNKVFGRDIATFIKTEQGFPTISEANLVILQDYIKEVLEIVIPLKNRPERDDKWIKRLHETILAAKDIVIVLKGTPGTRKTTTVYALETSLPCKIFLPTELSQWFQPSVNGEIKVLFLDEANKREPGIWDHLKGLVSYPRGILTDSGFMPLSDKHIIIASINHESTDRFFHSFLQSYGKVIYAPTLSDFFFETRVLTNLLNTQYSTNRKLLGLFIKVYHLISKSNDIHLYSLRDLENLAQRFEALTFSHERPTNESMILQILYYASIGEFAPGIRSKAKREAFLTALADLFGTKTHEFTGHIVNDKFYPRSYSPTIIALEQDLILKNYALAHGLKAFYKKVVLLEGPSLTGKTTLARNILLKNGFQPRHDDRTKRLYEINVKPGDPEQVLTIRRALQEEAAIIINEINLDPNIQTLINDFIECRGENPSRAIIIATQNNGSEAGRFISSPAMYNRVHFMQVGETNQRAAMREDMLEHANFRQVPSPEVFVDTILSAIDNGTANFITFYTLLDEFAQLTPQTDDLDMLNWLAQDSSNDVPIDSQNDSLEDIVALQSLDDVITFQLDNNESNDFNNKGQKRVHATMSQDEVTSQELSQNQRRKLGM